MIQYIVKIFLSAILITLISELAKKNGFIAALTASLPITSLMAMIWLYHDTHDVQKIINLSYGIFWMVIPSLAFFLILPMCLKMGMRFPWALFLSSMVTVLVYFLYTLSLKKMGIKI